MDFLRSSITVSKSLETAKASPSSPAINTNLLSIIIILRDLTLDHPVPSLAWPHPLA